MEGVTGVEELEAIARRFYAAGHGGLVREIVERLEDAADEVRPQFSRSALARLPRSGGLADIVARSTLSIDRHSTGLTITARGSLNLSGLNEGRLSHPVFGQPPTVSQNVPPGWFDEPAEQSEPVFTRAAERALDQVADYIEHGGPL